MTIRFSRSLHSNPFGKATEEMTIRLDEMTSEALTALAFAANKPRGEYIRDILQCYVHGHAAVLRARMAGPEAVQE